MNKYNKGFTMVEILVGVVIGIFITLAAYSSSLFFTKTSRSNVGMNDATQSASVGLYGISQEIRQGGLGLTSSNVIMCDHMNMYYNGAVLANNEKIGPVLIKEENSSDRISIQYSNSILGGATGQMPVAMANADAIIDTNAGIGIAVGNTFIMANGTNPCTVMSASAINPSIYGINISHEAGAGFLFNPPSASSFTSPVTYPAGSLIARYDNPVWKEYFISNNQLIMKDRITGQDYPIINNVVGLKAQYGVTSPTNNNLDEWVSPTGEWSYENIDKAHLNRIRSIRLAILVRSSQYERPEVAGAACEATPALPLTWEDGIEFNELADDNWQCYRYKTLNMVIPVKNVVYAFN